MAYNSYPLVIPEIFIDVVKLLLDSEGYLFGGAVRDLIRDEIPTDLDVSVRNYQKFYDGLMELGFEITPTSRAIKDNIIVDICELDDPDLFVDINIAPDFDVNILAWDGCKIFNYLDPEYNISDIIENIKNKRAQKITPNNERLCKMHNKGWIII
jgi:hypothetical protein